MGSDTYILQDSTYIPVDMCYTFKRLTKYDTMGSRYKLFVGVDHGIMFSSMKNSGVIDQAITLRL